ncbi:MAG: VOC family protein [Planctomycetes bacterium]|nr:VOC family protein [Planctomycetota bacterium]
MSQTIQQFPLAIIITVKDMQKSLAFYRDALGFEMKEAWPDRERPMWTNLLLDRQSVMLGVAMRAEDVKQWCGDDPEELASKLAECDSFAKNKPGVGITTYLRVDDVDAYHAKVKTKGIQARAPKTQFYGQRDFTLQDPDGYNLCFYTPIAMQNCQSCGMPMTDAACGQMFCAYCVDEKGELKPYEAVLEGCISGYFIPMQKLSRPEAEMAAHALLAKQPAWAARKK